MRRIFRRGLAFAAAAGLLCGAAGAEAQQITMERAVIAPGGGTATDGTVTMQATVAQPVAGTASNSEITGVFGFWNQAPSISSVDGVVGAGAITAISVTPSPLVADGTVEVTLATSGLVDVQLYNAQGEAAGLLFRGERAAGTFTIPIASDRLASGTYFVVVRTPGAMLQVPVTVTR